MKQRGWLQHLVIILSLILSGCASTSFNTNVKSLPSEQATVFGRVTVTMDGEPRRLSLWNGGSLMLVVQGPTNPAIIQYEIADPGDLFWSLPAGDYMILGYVAVGMGGGIRHGSLRVRFSVPNMTKVLYLGDLAINFNKSYYAFDIKDNFASRIETFRAKFPNAQLVPERRIANAEPSPGSYTKIRSICGTDWGIECTRDNAGVKPIYPDAPRNTVVDNLTPTLRWTPSPQADVTYDVIIYEEENFPRNQTGLLMDSLPGKQIHYVQELHEPILKLTSPLKPGGSYLWSVRLRRGETVSTWSTFGFFDFLGVGWTSGFGQWFKFSTPGK